MIVVVKKYALLFIMLSFTFAHAKQPKITVVIVVDQFAHHYLAKLKPHFKYGFKKLLDKGVCYENAYFPHGCPSTAPGHASLATGALPKDHGIILNSWVENNKRMKSSDDSAQNAAVFGRNGMLNYGRSAKNVMVDTLSDQFVGPNRIAWALSYKPRAAIAMAGKRGKAIWFNDNEQYYTSSKAYFDQLPLWLTDFNNKYKVFDLKELTWKLFYPRNHTIYKNFATMPYRFAGTTLQLANNITPVNLVKENKDTPHYNQELFTKIPYANELLLKLAQQCITNTFDPNKQQMLLWVSLSSLDRLGHAFGPNSLETIDMLLHLDKQLEGFMQFVKQKVGKENALFVLTADHGISPVPEYLHHQGLEYAKRISMQKLMTQMNNLIEKKYNIKNIVTFIKTNMIFLDREKLPIAHNHILHDIKKMLLRLPSIKNAWTYHELKNSTFHQHDIEQFLKNHLYPGRSGDIIFLSRVHTLIHKRHGGASHKNPYEHNTHVPLIVHQPDSIEKKVVYQKVWMQQLAGTLAQIIGCNRPSASSFSILPNIKQ